MLSALHLTSSRFFGGPERQMLGLAQALRGRVETVFASFSEGGLSGDFLGNVRRHGFQGICLENDTPYFLGAFREIGRLIRQRSIDVVICHGYKASLVGWCAARNVTVPAIAVSRGWTNENWKVNIYEILDRLVMRAVDRVVCVSHGQAEKVRRAGVSVDRIEVIHNAVRPDRFTGMDAAYGSRLRRMFSDPPAVIIGSAGRLSPEKGFGVLVDAAAEVVRKSPDVGFVLFGDGALQETLAARIADKGLEGRFVLAGFTSELDKFLPHFDVLAVPSFTEGLPNVALEAFAVAVPVVATDVGGNPELVVDCINGFLVAAGNVEALAHRLGELAENPALRRKMGDSALERVTQRFTFERQALSYLLLFESLLPGSKICRNPDALLAEFTARPKTTESE